MNHGPVTHGHMIADDGVGVNDDVMPQAGRGADDGRGGDADPVVLLRRAEEGHDSRKCLLHIGHGDEGDSLRPKVRRRNYRRRATGCQPASQAGIVGKRDVAGLRVADNVRAGDRDATVPLQLPVDHASHVAKRDDHGAESFPAKSEPTAPPTASLLSGLCRRMLLEFGRRRQDESERDGEPRLLAFPANQNRHNRQGLSSWRPWLDENELAVFQARCLHSFVSIGPCRESPSSVATAACVRRRFHSASDRDGTATPDRVWGAFVTTRQAGSGQGIGRLVSIATALARVPAIPAASSADDPFSHFRSRPQYLPIVLRPWRPGVVGNRLRRSAVHL